MLSAMGGSELITDASLQIKDTGNHILPTEGEIFIVITRKVVLALGESREVTVFLCELRDHM